MLSGYISIFANAPLNENSEHPKHPVGTKAVTPDGRTYRYAKAGANEVNVAELMVQADINGNHEDIPFAIIGNVGDNSISVALGATAVLANEYVGGYVVINDGDGEGHVYEIISHDASSAGGEDITIYIKPGLKVATVLASTVTLVRNPYSSFVVATGGTQTDMPVGVTVIAVTARYYCWLQVGGIASILTSGTNVPTANQMITIGEADDGSVSEKDAAYGAEKQVGYAIVGSTPVADEHNPYLLTLDT